MTSIEKSDGRLAKIFTAAMVIWDAMKADGAPLSERVAGLERTLREAWPFTREWKYLCVQCSDTGLVMGTCEGDATCSRHKVHLPHEYGTACWCAAGHRFKQVPRTEESAVAVAARVKKPTRLGR